MEKPLSVLDRLVGTGQNFGLVSLVVSYPMVWFVSEKTMKKPKLIHLRRLQIDINPKSKKISGKGDEFPRGTGLINVL